jgi:hypothetical protein
LYRGCAFAALELDVNNRMIGRGVGPRQLGFNDCDSIAVPKLPAFTGPLRVLT